VRSGDLAQDHPLGGVSSQGRRGGATLGAGISAAHGNRFSR
jgi:hypothetical protein